MRRRLSAVAALAGLALGGCVTPATGSDSYRDKAVTTLHAVRSEAATADLAVRLLEDGRATSAYADETISAAEQDVASVDDAFSSVQPPARSDDQTRAEVGDLVTRAGQAVAQARIAARRSDAAGLRSADRQLREIRAQAGDLAARLSGVGR